jgi:uridylate kinase
MNKNKRVLLKLSGEALAGGTSFGINIDKVKEVAAEIAEGYKKVPEMAIVVGGGNMWRGKTAEDAGFERANADYIGMLGTVMNALALKDALIQLGVPARVQTAVSMPTIAEAYVRDKAIKYIDKKNVVIFAAGTGNPYFSTDTAASLRAAEIGANVILAGKNGVDGVYDSDPNKNDLAKRFDTLTYSEMLARKLGVMDLTSATLSEENNIPTFVFSMSEKGNIAKAIIGEIIGTMIVPK